MWFRAFLILNFFCYYINGNAQQIANYVQNGSFEKIEPYPACKPIGWKDADLQYDIVVVSNPCIGNTPYLGFLTYQWPRTGNTLVFYDFYCPTCMYPYQRTCIKNELKASLVKDQIYCVKFYVCIGNNSTHGIDAFEAYFGDNTLDTIKYGHIPLSYITPQVRNPKGNIITDTLNWTLVTGTFVAQGTEKYMVIGNFETDANTDTVLWNPTISPNIVCEASLDDVSCIPVNLPAYAGPDKRCIVGDSVYLGRESDFAIDPYCQWYQLPNTTNTIAVNSGIWVKPTNTSTYVVRQELECGNVFWDTVVVYRDEVGLNELKIKNEELKISPSPATNEIMLSLAHSRLSAYFERIEILNTQGLVLKEILISNSEPSLEISVADLESGVYLLRLMDGEKERVVVKKVTVQH